MLCGAPLVSTFRFALDYIEAHPIGLGDQLDERRDIVSGVAAPAELKRPGAMALICQRNPMRDKLLLVTHLLIVDIPLRDLFAPTA